MAIIEAKAIFIATLYGLFTNIFVGSIAATLYIFCYFDSHTLQAFIVGIIAASIYIFIYFYIDTQEERICISMWFRAESPPLIPKKWMRNKEQ